MRTLFLSCLLFVGGCASSSDPFLGSWSGDLHAEMVGDVSYETTMPITITFVDEGDGIVSFGDPGCQPHFRILSPSRAELDSGTCVGSTFLTGDVRLSPTDTLTVDLTMSSSTATTYWSMTLERAQ